VHKDADSFKTTKNDLQINMVFYMPEY